MIRRLSILLLAAILASTTACRMQSASRAALIAGGAAVVAGGYAVSAQGPVDSDNNGQNDFGLNDNFGAYALGGVLMLTGIAMVIGGLAAQPAEQDAARLPQAGPAGPPIAATSPVMFPGLAVNGAVVTSSVTPLTIDLTGWSIGQPYIIKGRTHLTAVGDSTKLEMVLQRVVRPVSADEVVARLDLSAYGPMARRASSIGGVPAVEIIGATSDTVPVLVTVAVAEQQLLSIVCHGATPTCRDAIARSTWTVPAS